MRYFLIAVLFSVAPLSAHATEKPFLAIHPVISPMGIQAWLVEDHAQPVIAMEFGFVRSGTAYEPAQKQGLVRLLSNMLDEGAGDMDSTTFQAALENNSISLSFGASRDVFTGSLKTLVDTQDTAFDLLALAISAPRFDEEALSRMREANMTRIRSSMNDGEWIAARLFNDRIFEGHPYALNSGGTLSTLPRVTADDLRAYHKGIFTRDRLRVTVVGDVTPEELGKILDRVFAALPAKGQDIPLNDITPQNLGKTFVYDYDAPQTQIMMAAPAPEPTDPDYAATVVMNHIFGGGGFGSRLMDVIREKSGLTYGIYSGLSDMDHTATLSIQSSTRNETAAQLLAMVKEEITRLRDKGATEAEVKAAKGYLLGSMPAALTSTDRIAELMLSMMIDGRPLDYLDQYRAQISGVTPNAVHDMAQKWLRADGFMTLLVGKPQEIPNPIRLTDVPNVK